MAIRFEDIKEFIGSRVLWDDRADLFTPEAAAAIRAKVEARTVVVFPQANLTDQEQLAITEAMGEKIRLTARNNVQNNDQDVYQVTLDEKINPQPEYVLGTFFWHMDGITVDMPPPFATLLSCRIAPDKGGETEFASTYAAYEGLPEEEKQALEGLKAVHSVRASLSPIADAIPEKHREKVLGIGLIKEHPLVWTHESGRKSMVIGTTADHIVGMEVPAGRAMLIRLQEWAAQPAFSLRHKWTKGDFVIWDNTGAMHRAIPYDKSTGRMMHRTSIAGTEAVAA
ncbi:MULTISPECIES: TauD/TfdA dioxygenase family protein [Novosphingobium]|jgi:alpha-ketoglutarate-dependent taurine dioxygenase|uniref:TauD/TfdA dioxygenase family protein n=1 Tax=Novosphingobium TaxID=165696 RepID=UPI0022F27106|nr:TauD/TfdA family dioxygenase [Novosphingobium resinovorum]GLK46852.1 taurine catabolism dioxygenase [Novosphingobium resinovorum]